MCDKNANFLKKKFFGIFCYLVTKVDMQMMSCHNFFWIFSFLQFCEKKRFIKILFVREVTPHPLTPSFPLSLYLSPSHSSPDSSLFYLSSSLFTIPYDISMYLFISVSVFFHPSYSPSYLPPSIPLFPSHPFFPFLLHVTTLLCFYLSSLIYLLTFLCICLFLHFP